MQKLIKVFFFLMITFLTQNIVLSQSKNSDPFKSDYIDYVPDFISKIKNKEGWEAVAKDMDRSSEIKFYTLNEVAEINRANSLVKVGIENELSGDFRKAMEIYQEVITKFNVENQKNEVLYRVSSYGVFVPVAQYCQRRLLNFPIEQLDFYRTLHDPEARELFDEAVKKYSLEIFSEIVDRYLATSYGGKALQFLGDAALDRGNYLEALEHFNTIIDFIPDKNLQTPELKLKIQFCEKALGQSSQTKADGSNTAISERDLQLLKNAIQKESPINLKIHSQKNSRDYTAMDDYTRFKATDDPLGLKAAEWSNEMIGSKNEFFVYTQPVVTDTSVIFRSKNIIFCYSIINGNLRWKNDIGGRANWQNWEQRQYPLEDIVIQDGVVVTPLNAGGSSLVALDEITGQIKWCYGSIAATDGEESKMRFECAPSAGPSMVYANYVLDNIKGDTHIDTEYGVIAFDISNGQVKWRRQICRLQPGKFDASFGGNKRNRIRSFISPPLYHEGTVYVSSNAGAVSAMDSLSGRIKWLMRYPYYPSVHDATKQFGSLRLMRGLRFVMPHMPMFWLNQRPLVVGEHLYVLPVNSPFMFCIDRRSGKVNWSFQKPTDGFSYFLGPISTGELVITGNGRDDPEITVRGRNPNYFARDPVYLIDPKTGNIKWRSADYVKFDKQPVMATFFDRTPAQFDINNLYFETATRPFLSEDDKVIISGWSDVSHYRRPDMFIFALGEIDLKNRKMLGQRRYYSGGILAAAETIINDKETRIGPYPVGAALYYDDLMKMPRRNKEEEIQAETFKKIMEDSVPINDYPAFMPFSRLTFTRYGIPFELRVSPRTISMVYNRADLEKKTKNDSSLMSLFSRSELSLKDGDYQKASDVLNKCLALVSSEDVSFRALIKQQYHKVYLELVCASIRAKKSKRQLENALGMANTASVLSEEIQTLFALTEAYSKNGNYKNAIDCLRVLIEVHGSQEFPVSSLTANAIFYKSDFSKIAETFDQIVDDAKENAGHIYTQEIEKALELTKNSFPLYLSTVSPLPKELMVRTADLACLKLIEILESSGEFKQQYNKIAEAELIGDNIDQLIFRLWQYPNTSKGQEAFDRVYKISEDLPQEDKRVVWRKLVQLSKICGFKLPAEIISYFKLPNKIKFSDIIGAGNKTYVVDNFKDGIMFPLERFGDQSIHANLTFIGVKLPKKIGYRFSLVCFDVSQDKEIWRKDEFRLKDLGNEPGFYAAFIYSDVVLVHGIYDVFCFRLKDGEEIWHYKTPNNFDIFESIISDNIFVLSGANETIALQVDTKIPVGEVAWQTKEQGSIYFKPYLADDLFVSVRKFPFNITSRHRTTGNLMMRLSIPDLSLVETHPILKEGGLMVPFAKFDKYLAVTDEKYLIVYDVVKMSMLWKTPLLNIDITKEIKIRFEMNDKYIIVLKENFDKKELYCYDLFTGDILWKTDPTNNNSPQPIYSLLFDGDILYGLGEHPEQGFILIAYDCSKGIQKFKKVSEGYSSKPSVNLRKEIYGNNIIVELQDRKDFKIIVFNKNSGEILKTISEKGDGPIGEIGRIGIIVQGGRPILFNKNQFKY